VIGIISEDEIALALQVGFGGARGADGGGQPVKCCTVVFHDLLGGSWDGVRGRFPFPDGVFGRIFESPLVVLTTYGINH
jgi:hypothetical protein